MQFIPYLGFDGRCKEAFGLYRAAFNGAISMQMMYADGVERFGTLKDRFGKAWMVAV